MTFQENIAQLVIGNITLRDLPSIAMQEVENGNETPSMIILAGLDKNENEFVIQEYLNEVLSISNITIPEKRESAIIAALAVADEIIAGKQDIYSGTRDLYWNCLMQWPFHEESTQYAYDSISFAKVYGLYDTLDDLMNAGSTKWSEEKSNEDLAIEVRGELLKELKIWVTHMRK